MRQLGLLLSVALLGVAGCGSADGITDPREIEANLVGGWVQSPVQPERVSTSINLLVNGATVTGAGHWFGEASNGGSIDVTGAVVGALIQLQLAEDNGTTLHFTGSMVNDNLISGAFVGNGPAVAVKYSRQDPAHPE